MIYIFAIIFATVFELFILNLVRKNKLDEKYSILWIIFGIVILIVSIFPNIIVKIANLFSVYYPPALLLLIGIIVVGIYIVHITMVITKQNKIIVRLAQELSIRKQDKEKNENSKK